MKKICIYLLFAIPFVAKAQCVSPADPLADTLAISCGSSAVFTPQGGGNYFFYTAQGDSLLAIGNSYQINNLITDTTIGVQEYALGPVSPIVMPAQTSTFGGNVRGYYFTSPVAAMITGVDVPTDASTGDQSIAIVRFQANPPVYSTTTNDFELLYLTQNNPAAGIIPLNILIQPGDIIGVLGQRGGICSYATGPVASSILGQPITVSRLGMQFPLSTTSPQQLWTENAGSISRVNLYFAEVCVSDTVVFTAIVDELPVTISSNVATVCESGNVQFDVTGASSYQWNTGSVNTSETYFIDSVTTIIVAGTDVNGCSGSDTLVFSPTENPTVSIVSSNQFGLCENDTIQLTGTGADTYLWSNGAVQQTINVDSNSGVNFIVFGTDANGCTNSDTITLQLLPLPIIDLGVDVFQCEGMVTIDAGFGFNYAWSTGETSQQISVVTSGDYSATITDTLGCSNSDTVQVTINSNPVVSGQSSSNSLCEYSNDAILTGSPVGGTWTGTGITGSSFDPSNNIGTNTLTYSFTDANGCSNEATITITVDGCAGVNESFEAQLLLFPNPTTGTITIQNIDPSFTSVKVLDQNGKELLVKSISQSDLNLDLQSLANGTYVIQFTGASNQMNRMIQIQK